MCQMSNLYYKSASQRVYANFGQKYNSSSLGIKQFQ